MNTVVTFCKQFRDTCQQWRGDFEERLKGTGQTITKARALLYLSELDKTITQKQLAQLLGIEEPSVVRMVDGLEKSGLVKRQVSLQDKRVNYVVLTTAAMPVVVQVQQIAANACRDALAGIPEDKLLVAYEVLTMISKNVA